MDLEPSPPLEGRWLDGLRERASRSMHPAVWALRAGGARGEVCGGRGQRRLARGALPRRVLRAGGEADLATSLLGAEVASPIAVAPTAMQRACTRRRAGDGARVPVRPGSLHVVSSNAGTRSPTRRGGAVVAAGLPPPRARPRAARRGGSGRGRRPRPWRDGRHAVPGTKRGVDDEDWPGLDLSWWRSNYPEADDGGWKNDLTLDDVGWLREATRGSRLSSRACCAGTTPCAASMPARTPSTFPTTAADSWTGPSARRRVARGRGGGGRPGRGVRGRRHPVRRRRARRARPGCAGVFVGRPALWALAVEGARGVTRLLRELVAELREALELAGCADPGEAPDLL